jgi:hypothetical protein
VTVSPLRSAERDRSAAELVQGTLALAYPPVEDDQAPDDPARWALRFVSALVEVLSGDRSPAQLTGWTSRAVFSSVTRYAQSTGRRRLRHHRRSGRDQVASVRVSLPRDGVLEVSARIRSGERYRALAARLDQTDDGWRCTALQLG